MNKLRVCIVDDDPKIVYAISIILEEKGYEIISCSRGNEFINMLQENKRFGVVFLDITMPDISGLQVLKKMRDKGYDIPVVVITGFGTMDTAIKAIQLGALEYITKPLDMKEVLSLTKLAMEISNKKNKNRDEQFILKEKQDTKEEVIGNSHAMQEVFKMIGAITTTPNVTPVLIEGESGTGKELVAKALHRNASNKDEPFIVINCTTLPENLLESELFGHEKGAFTGAFERKLGKLEIAKNGSIFFDEIGELSPNLQQKLLRVLQEREFERLGSNTLQKVEARFIFATNTNLEKEVSEGRFREDLWFRINVISINIPPLRERKDDIPLLLKYFLKRFNFELGKSVTEVPDNVLKFLINYDYPGNVRELSNLIERGIILSKDQTFSLYSLPDIVLHNEKSPNLDVALTNFNLKKARQDMLSVFEKKYLIDLLKKHHGNVALATKTAGIERQSFYRLLKKYEIDPKVFHP
jgi:DNA-binding NtrC family response regulator